MTWLQGDHPSRFALYPARHINKMSSTFINLLGFSFHIMLSSLFILLLNSFVSKAATRCKPVSNKPILFLNILFLKHDFYSVDEKTSVNSVI